MCTLDSMHSHHSSGTEITVDSNADQNYLYRIYVINRAMHHIARFSLHIIIKYKIVAESRPLSGKQKLCVDE